MILHCDLDSFFVSVECVHDPSLRGKPAAVGGNAHGRGVIASASYEARAMGIHSGMPTAKALSLCPSLRLIRPVHGRYSEYSGRFFDILREITPDIEIVSIDEAYIDAGPIRNLRGSADQIARLIRRRTKEELGLPVSIGIGSSKYIAKCGSKLAKPDGLYVVTAGSEKEFLHSLDIEKLNGVGHSTASKLHKLGIKKIGDILLYKKDLLAHILGKHGEWLYSVASGEYTDSINTGGREQVKSVGNSHTFREDLRYEEAIKELKWLAEKVGARTRKKNLLGKTITLKVRYSDFSTFTTAYTLSEYTNFSNTIHKTAKMIFKKYSGYHGKFRLLGITLSNMIEGNEGIQEDLIHYKDNEKLRRLYKALDHISEKYGGAV